ncbi:MAG: hypothetical protein OEV74_17565, partial [Cyclobacteriaceae bacterium]|nr:hypothetical protein [Cyclobacteriaceae bacterium]
MIRVFALLLLASSIMVSCSNEGEPILDSLAILSFKIDGTENLGLSRIQDVSQTPVFEITFSTPIKPEFAS